MLLDASGGMLRQARRNRGWFSKDVAVQGDAMSLPLRTASVDLVFSNLLLPWIDDLQAAFAEVARVLRKGGLFLFSTLGPDSLSEIREAWASVDDGPHVIPFADMHDIGDGLIRAGFADPVLDTDRLHVSYRDTSSLFKDLTGIGARNCLAGRLTTLTGKGRFRRLESGLQRRFSDGVLDLHLELVYGHAWGAGPPQPAGEYHINPDGIDLTLCVK